MTTIDPHDPARYIGPRAVVMTPIEQVLRQELRRLTPRVDEEQRLRPHERDRIATLLRASRDAAHKFDGEVRDD